MEPRVTSVGAPRPLPAEEGGLASPLRVGTYECREILGSSITGITYSGWDHARDAQVVIKEFLPAAFAVRQPDGSVAPQGRSSAQSFADSLRQFLGAADALAEARHENVVRVRGVTESNGTGYVAMDHVEGETLDAVLSRSGTLGRPQLDAMLPPLLDGLEALHTAELLHLELRPDKIVLRADGSPVMLAYGATRQGFTAARQILSDRSKGRRLLHSPSLYAPVELYSADAKWGQWTDIYSLGAILYECVSGAPPPTAPGRLIDDSMVPLEELEAKDFDPATLAGIQAALDTRPADRPQQVAAWRRLFTGGSGPEGVNAPLARTSARGAAVLARRTAGVGASPARRARWAVPVLALAAAGSLITYLDTSVLRAPGDAGGQDAADLLSPIARLADRGTNRVSPVANRPRLIVQEPPVVTPTGLAGLRVETSPANAEVWLAGRFVGRTPLVLEGQPAGRFEIELKHPHCESVVLADQLLEDHEELRIEQALTRGKGNLMVTTDPAGAWVEFEGRRLIDSTPGLLRDLPAGPVELRVGAPGRRAVKVFADVPKDGTRYLAQALVTPLES